MPAAKPYLPDYIDPKLDLDRIYQECEKMIKKRSYVSAGTSIVPIPLADVVADAGSLAQLLPQISQKFRLTDSDTTSKKAHFLHGELLTRAKEFAALAFTRSVAKRSFQGIATKVASKQLAKFVPFSGQLIAATLGYQIFNKIATEHLDECYQMAKSIQQRSKTQDGVDIQSA